MPVIGFLGSASATWPLMARAQQADARDRVSRQRIACRLCGPSAHAVRSMSVIEMHGVPKPSADSRFAVCNSRADGARRPLYVRKPFALLLLLSAAATLGR